LPKAELADFARIYAAHQGRAYRWDIWAAGVVIAHGMDEPGFDRFRDWLISRGQAACERALADPDSLADVPDIETREVNAEEFGTAVFNVYEDVHGEDLPLPEEGLSVWAPRGTPWKANSTATSPRVFLVCAPSPIPRKRVARDNGELRQQPHVAGRGLCSRPAPPPCPRVPQASIS
jgi:hypothetical protein